MREIHINPENPVLVICNFPGIPIRSGALPRQCDRCDGPINIRPETAATVAQQGTSTPPVVCYGCAQWLCAHHPALRQRPPTDVIGNRAYRRRFGLDN